MFSHRLDCWLVLHHWHIMGQLISNIIVACSGHIGNIGVACSGHIGNLIGVAWTNQPLPMATAVEVNHLGSVTLAHKCTGIAVESGRLFVMVFHGRLVGWLEANMLDSIWNKKFHGVIRRYSD